MVKELWELSASEIVRKIETKEITAKDVAVSCAERIKDLDPEINAWTYFDRNRFVENAEAVDKKLLANNNIGKLEGVPVGVKDIFNTADMPTCMGSKIWKGFTPGNDARAVFRVKQEGGVVAGKTVTAEFAVHDPGPTRNPHNIDHYPGTSSSGSAAAVSCGMVPVSLGTLYLFSDSLRDHYHQECPFLMQWSPQIGRVGDCNSPNKLKKVYFIRPNSQGGRC